MVGMCAGSAVGGTGAQGAYDFKIVVLVTSMEGSVMAMRMVGLRMCETADVLLILRNKSWADLMSCDESRPDRCDVGAFALMRLHT